MELLIKSKSEKFLERFHRFDDGVIRSVETVYPYAWFTMPAPIEERESKRVRLLLSVVDSQCNDAWCNVCLELRDVQELKILEPHEGYHAVLSDGLKLGWFGDMVYVDFSLDVEELTSVEGFQKTHRYVAARQLFWRVEPYDR